MALNKQQSYALYLLLTTESSTVRNLRSANCASRGDFLRALQNEVNMLENGGAGAGAGAQGPTVDDTLGNLWSGNDSIANVTILDTKPRTVLAALPELAAGYGGGPCPKAAEAVNIWNATRNIIA